MTTLSAKERSLALLLAKGPYYSYETASVARLLGVKKAELVALAQSLGDKTGDPVSDHNMHIASRQRACATCTCIAGQHFQV